MQYVQVSRKELLDKLRTNREKHRKIFLEACEGYREQVILELERMLDEARRGKRVRQAVELEQPMDQTKEYDCIIKMLEMEKREYIDLSHQDFRCYVMDEWTWKQQFSTSNARYIKTKDLTE